MPATSGIADVSIAGMARSYAARLSCPVSPLAERGDWLLFSPEGQGGDEVAHDPMAPITPSPSRPPP